MKKKKHKKQTGCKSLLFKINQIMKTLNTTLIEATEFTDKATVLSLDSVPTIEQQNELFGGDDSVILEF